jgi:hypothetical protein
VMSMPASPYFLMFLMKISPFVCDGTVAKRG